MRLPARALRDPLRLLIGSAAAAILLAAAPPPAVAHEDPGVQVTEVTRQIELRPDDAALYLRRADLYRSRREWAAGVADLQTARRLDPELDVVDLLLAQLLLGADNPEPALAAADRFLERHPGHAGAHLTRARILVRLGSRRDAVAAFDRGIELARSGDGKGAQPDDYIDRARLMACDDEASIDAAIRGLDEGSAALGGPITLQLAAVDLEIGRRRWDSALVRLSAIEARAHRKEAWIARRADVLLLAGRGDEARKAYAEAASVIEALPERLRTTGSTAELVARVRAGAAGRVTPVSLPPTPLGSVCAPATSPLGTTFRRTR